MKVTYKVTIDLESGGRMEVGVLNIDDKDSENLKAMGYIEKVDDVPILAGALVAEAIERSMFYRIRRIVRPSKIKTRDFGG